MISGTDQESTMSPKSLSSAISRSRCSLISLSLARRLFTRSPASGVAPSQGEGTRCSMESRSGGVLMRTRSFASRRRNEAFVASGFEPLFVGEGEGRSAVNLWWKTWRRDRVSTGSEKARPRWPMHKFESHSCLAWSN